MWPDNYVFTERMEALVANLGDYVNKSVVIGRMTDYRNELMIDGGE